MISTSSWIERAIARGILTSRYPKEEATSAEVPRPGAVPYRSPAPRSSSQGATAVPSGRSRPSESTKANASGAPAACPPASPLPARSRRPSPSAPTSSRGTDARGTGPSPAPLRELGRSLHVFLVDVGSCNACNLEVLALSNPFYDASRLGVFLTNSPRHADVLLVVGVPTPEMTEPLRRVYEALPEPRAVIAVGACPISGGAFAGTGELAGSLSEVVPVDRFVPGCPPPPVAILDAILALAGRGRRSREG